MFKSMKRIIRWAGKYKARLYLGSVCSFFSSLSTAIPTMAAAFALDKAIQAYWTNTAIDTVLIWQTLWIIIGSIVLNFLLSYLRAVLQESIGYEVAAGQRIHLGDVLKRVPLGYFSQNSVGDILAGVTTELSTLELQGMKMVDVIINGYAKFIAIVLCLIFFSPVAAVISIVGVALSALALQGISRHSEKTAATTHKAMEDMSGATIEYIRGLSIVKSFGQEGASIENFRNASKDLKDIHIKVEKGFTPFNCLHLFALKLASMGIVFICAWQALQGQMSMAFFLMFVLFSFVMFGSVENINDAAHTLGVVDSAMNKLEALENVNYIDQDGTDIKPATYDIEFRDVSFGYDSRIVLHDLNFKIPQNSTTAIVGPSGSGKSTLCNLIARFYDVNSGTITIGGTDIRRFTCDSLLKNISMVFQNVYLFRDTIKNNIKFGSPDATDEQIVAAAKAARCHDFIMALPDGYDTVIGEGGSSLSGGEKQRISIARAMLKDAPIVILDEATASIDPENEHLIQEAISALTHGKTIITIAHRLATIENADQILVIDGGTVAQRGTHIIKRSEGRSAVAAAAYRSGTKLTNEWDGLTHDYTRKGGVVHAEIMLPAHAPPEFADRSTLWNSVEQIEKARDSQLAREIEAALPRELSREQQLALVRAYVKDNFVDKGMCADFAIHDKGTGNPHVHIMLTVRPLKENGAWGAKCRKAYDLDENGQRIPDERGGWKNHREDTTDWNDKGNVEIWRAAWAAYTNRALEAAGQPALVDHRSYKRQGIDKIPSVHLGPAASQMEKRGIRTDKGEVNRQIAADNKLLKEIKARITRPYNWSKAEAEKPEGQQPSMIDLWEAQQQLKRPDTRTGKIRALQESAALFSFLQANGIQSMQQLHEKIADMNTHYYDLRREIVKAERRIAVLTERGEMWAQYNEYKTVHKQLARVKPEKRELFEQRHSRELILYDAAARYLKELKASGEEITPKEWRREIDLLTAQKQVDSIDMKAMREELKAVERLRKAADQLARQERDKPRDRGPER